jgi:hypothetical protein
MAGDSTCSESLTSWYSTMGEGVTESAWRVAAAAPPMPAVETAPAAAAMKATRPRAVRLVEMVWRSVAVER